MSPNPIATMLRRLRPRPSGDPRAAQGEELDLAALPPADRRIVERALPYTMTGVARLHALVDAVRYCVRRDVPGDFAECGVWQGGSILAMLLTLRELGVSDRDMYLFDTFEGMTAPTEHDVSLVDEPALETWRESRDQGTRAWGELFDPAFVNENVVEEKVLSAGYPAERIHFVKGPVEETLPLHAPDRLALLRLDTDWYESTRHELIHLFPRLSEGGVLIIDDYGHWAGCKQAVDEYFDERKPILLSRVDYTARIGVKH
jgi:hypothetical protein